MVRCFALAAASTAALLLPRSSLVAGLEDASWLKDTHWKWNNWRTVEFHRDGSFSAPDGNCEERACTWQLNNRGIVEINWRNVGMHYARPSRDKKRLQGERFDGQPIHAVFERKFAKSGDEWKDPDSEDYDPYRVLGVDADDDAKRIKKAFRKLSLKYHPDRNSGKGKDPEAATAMFEAVRVAYEVVGDEDKRMLFDTGGMDLVRDSEKQDNSGGGGAMDPFAAFFGGGQQQKQRQANKGPDARVQLEVSLENMYMGAEIGAQINRRVICRGCKNKPRKGKCAECGRCPNEVRTVTRTVGPGFQVQQQEEVPSKHRCKEESTTLNAVIEKGMGEGSEIVFERKSEQRPGQIPGDVIMVIKQKRNDKFRREGNDLHIDMKISLKEALVGYKKSITHLDGHLVALEDDGVTKPFQVRKIKGEGMPLHEVPSEYGDMYVKIEVVMPRHLTEEEKEWVLGHFNG